jgi:hypothetical protein
MLVRDILLKIDFGNPVAEYDKGLQNYFWVTDAFRHLVSGNVDIIAGDKGTGKTAIYQHLKQSYGHIEELKGIEIITGFNPSGEPVFRRLGNERKLTDGQYITVWKMFILSLVGNWLLKKYRGSIQEKGKRLELLLSKLDLLSTDDSAGTIFTRLIHWLHNYSAISSVEYDLGINEFGISLIQPKIEGEPTTTAKNPPAEMISHHEALSILDEALAEQHVAAWVVMDRLDEAFVGRPDIEALALRALIRTFMDLQEFEHICLKLFVRNDLFRKITKEGFVNLTHVSARRREISWEDKDLYAMLCQRIRKNQEILRTIGLTRPNNTQLFSALFPVQVAPGKGKQSTWHWMLAQISDGNAVTAPRNVIDLCLLAQEEQLRKEVHTPREYAPPGPLIEFDSLKKAALRLSTLRVEDTLLAEYGDDVKRAIKAFSNGKSEHTEKTLADLFNIPDRLLLSLIIKVLCDIGFLEQDGDKYSVPIIYRYGLNITQGKANGYNGNANQKPKSG